LKKLVLFDIDGTLIDSGRSGTKALEMTFKRLYGIEKAMDEIEPDGKTDLAIIREIFLRKLFRQPTKEEMMKASFFYLHFLRKNIRVTTKYTLKPGVKKLLETLRKESGVITGLATGNLRRGAFIKLSRGRLFNYFEVGGYGSDSEDRIEVINIAIRRARQLPKGREIEEIYVVGDTPLDIESGRKAGGITVAVATGKFNKEELLMASPDFVFDNFSNPEDFLDLLK